MMILMCYVCISMYDDARDLHHAVVGWLTSSRRRKEEAVIATITLQSNLCMYACMSNIR